MSKKVKISRKFTFKAYCVNNDSQVLNNAHEGEFMFKSECHYYAEKYVLDFVKNNIDSQELVGAKKFTIYKISTIEDSNIEDMLIEQIYVKDGEINID